jgi:hypothetical protein
LGRSVRKVKDYLSVKRWTSKNRRSALRRLVCLPMWLGARSSVDRAGPSKGHGRRFESGRALASPATGERTLAPEMPCGNAPRGQEARRWLSFLDLGVLFLMGAGMAIGLAGVSPSISQFRSTPHILAKRGKSLVGIMLLRPPSYFPYVLVFRPRRNAISAWLRVPRQLTMRWRSSSRQRLSVSFSLSCSMRTLCPKDNSQSSDTMALIFGTDCPKTPSMSEFASFRSIIELWPSREAMAADTGAPATAVSKWWQRDRLPAEWWSSVLGTAKAAENGVTADLLTALAAREAAEVRA